MKNILFITGSDKFSGPNKQLINLLESLSKNKKLNISLYICKIINNQNNSLLKKIKFIKNINYYSTKSLSNNNISIKIFSNLFDIYKLHKNNNFNIIQTSGIIPDFYIFILKKLFFIRSTWIIYVRSQIRLEYLIRYKKFFIGYLIGYIHQLIINSSDKIICVSKAVEKHIVYKKNKSQILYNSLIIEEENKILNFYKSKKFKNKTKNSSNKILNFTYAGHFDELKNPLFLINFWNKKTTSNLKLNLFGSYNESNYFSKMMRFSQKSKNIYLNDFTSNIINMYLSSNIFISASRTEGFPNTVIEALSCGCICLLSDIAPHKELKELFPKYIFLYKSNSEDSLDKNIKKILYYYPSITRLLIVKESTNFFSSKLLAKRYLKIINYE